MISEQRIRELIALGNENRNLDYKGAFSWATASKDEKCEIVKDVLAFANTRDGGVILVGINDKTGVFEGLSDEQYPSFDQTKFNEFVHKYVDPRHTSFLHKKSIDGKKIVAIEVPEFGDVPILCKHSVQNGTKNTQLILRQAGLYKRTDKATSELIEDADEMRELLNRGILRRQDDLFRAFKQILLPARTKAPLEPAAEFRREIEDGNRYFSELENGKLVEFPHWLIVMQPETYKARRMPNLLDLQRHVQNSAVSLRGWTFPIVGRVGNSPWSNFDGGSQSFYSSIAHSAEAFRAYQSGLILWCAGVFEDAWPAFQDKNVLSFVGAIYSTTEWMLFAKRYFEPLLAVDETVRIEITLSGAKNRKLISNDYRVAFHWDLQANNNAIRIEEVILLSELRADAETIARRIVRRIFEQFNWNDPSEEMLQKWQQDFMTGRF